MCVFVVCIAKLCCSILGAGTRGKIVGKRGFSNRALSAHFLCMCTAVASIAALLSLASLSCSPFLTTPTLLSHAVTLSNGISNAYSAEKLGIQMPVDCATSVAWVSGGVCFAGYYKERNNMVAWQKDLAELQLLY